MRIFQKMILRLGIIFLFYALSVSIGCTEKSEMEKLRQYYNSINAEQGAVTGATIPLPTAGAPIPPTPSSEATHIVAGTPRTSREGFCGDGIINGTTEDCDQGAIQNTACRDYNGIAGEVRCQPNCLYDISDCMTPRVDKDIGGIAETCKCHCNTSPCNGGCKSAIMNGQGICEFDCDNECICQCQGKLNAHVQECKFNCLCTVDANGNPDCTCNLDQCDILTTVSQNIGTIVSSPAGFGGILRR